MWLDYLALLAGIACAAIGGEVFVRGTVGLARSLRVSAGVVAVTIAAFATSSPELSVSISSALAGRPEIALGDALGSNVVNVALILGAALSISGIKTARSAVKRDFPVAILIPAVTGVLLVDGGLSRIDGALLLGGFLAWLIVTVVDARNERSAAAEVLGAGHGWSSSAYCIVGVALLAAAGRLIVMGASSIARELAVPEFLVGASIVAVGTSVPELATAIISKLRGHDEVGLGTILGSNIFNGLFIVGTAASIHPIAVGWRTASLALILGVLALICSYPSQAGSIGRARGPILVGLFVVYLTLLVLLPGL